MKAFKTYMATSSLAIIIAAIAFWKFININAASICPLFLAFLSLLQIMTFISSANSADEGETETAFLDQNGLTRIEQSVLFRIHGLTKIAILPSLVVFSIFFSPVYKIIIPIATYIASFLVARWIFIKKRDNH